MDYDTFVIQRALDDFPLKGITAMIPLHQEALRHIVTATVANTFNVTYNKLAIASNSEGSTDYDLSGLVDVLVCDVYSDDTDNELEQYIISYREFISNVIQTSDFAIRRLHQLMNQKQ